MTTEQWVGTLLFAAVVTLGLLAGDPGWTPILDSANLAFHEAGHLVYGVFGDTAALYGGVLGQLTFPLVVIGVFAARRQPHAVAVGAVWLGQNCMNIARYMADARAQELPLVGGGEHDFFHIFTRWDALDADTKVAAWTRGIGWVIGVTALAWLTWRWRRGAADDDRTAP